MKKLKNEYRSFLDDIEKNIKNKEGKYIVFCKNKKHLQEIKETVIGWFKKTK